MNFRAALPSAWLLISLSLSACKAPSGFLFVLSNGLTAGRQNQNQNQNILLLASAKEAGMKSVEMPASATRVSDKIPEQLASKEVDRPAERPNEKLDDKPTDKSPDKSPDKTPEKPAEHRAELRLEELFIWKASEELKLPPLQEQKFTDIIHKLGVRKRNAAEILNRVSRELDSVKTKLEAEHSLKRYHEALKEYQAIQLAEFDQLKSLFGAEKLARYIVVKTELSEKLKTLLSAPPTQNSGQNSGNQGTGATVSLPILRSSTAPPSGPANLTSPVLPGSFLRNSTNTTPSYFEEK